MHLNWLLFYGSLSSYMLCRDKRSRPRRLRERRQVAQQLSTIQQDGSHPKDSTHSTSWLSYIQTLWCHRDSAGLVGSIFAAVTNVQKKVVYRRFHKTIVDYSHFTASKGHTYIIYDSGTLFCHVSDVEKLQKTQKRNQTWQFVHCMQKSTKSVSNRWVVSWTFSFPHFKYVQNQCAKSVLLGVQGWLLNDPYCVRLGEQITTEFSVRKWR